VDFSCADEGSSGLASCVGTTADGALLDTSNLGDVSVTVTARDNAGNETVVTHTVTVVDVTAPEISITTPVEGAEYARDAVVNADYSCTDEPGGSALETCEGDVANGDPIDTTTLGEHTFTVEASDSANNANSRSVTYTVVDTTGPAITVTSPAEGAVYSVGQVVAADYACADEPGGSGLATCVGTVPDGVPVDTSSIGQKSFRVDATDSAGNATSKTVSYTVADRAGPSVVIATPADGAVYSKGERVLAAYTCADQPGGSGVATCNGTVPNGSPVDTSGLGPHSFTVTATDKAGNSVSKTVTYNVGYSFKGFLWPVKNPPKANRWKAGVPVPIRFSLNGFRGSRPEAEGYPRSTRCGGGDTDVIGSKRHPVFDYSRRLDQYLLIWKTDRRWAGKCREFTLKLDDGTVHTARFEFVKPGRHPHGKPSRKRDRDWR
jgi:hypothetical protein